MIILKTHTNNPVDYRSDTLTRPSPAMREAMASADVGDDVYGEDPSVNQLEQTVADLLGKQASLFVSSGTQGNLLALLSHCARGDEFISGDVYHVYSHEAGGAAVLGGIASTALQTGPQLELSVDDVRAAIKPDNNHFAISRLLCLENTISGRVQQQSHLLALCDVAHGAGMQTHLDGARLMNAVVAQGISAAEIAAPFDSISLCLSKGLGAPVGSVLAGSQAFIDKARRGRKLLGGGTRQAGILASGGLYALNHHVERLAEDHSNATLLAEGIARLGIMPVEQHTNMVFITPPADHITALCEALLGRGIIIAAGSPSIRMVTHLDISRADIETTIEAFEGYFSAIG
ncbi:MAG: low-specificity L-threonine aldolase [Gammaproteobacteria bacterium]|nr:low-specificity L-threonine aldolase [Gammaproteobacteria bacterium]